MAEWSPLIPSEACTSMKEKFEVSYRITEDEWRQAAANRWNPEAEPVFDCFYGDIQLSSGKALLFPGAGFNMSVADLACGLAEILQRDLPLIGGDRTSTFSQSDDALTITFDRRDDHISVTTNLKGASKLETSVPAFFAGTREFIERFAEEASSRIPSALEWKDLTVLRSFRSLT